VSTTDIGNRGENIASVFLTDNGYKVIDQNWKTRWCEIDLIAKKNNIVYFVEVKYRKSDVFGDGFSYITPKKLQQMRFAAEFWIHKNSYNGECNLSAISIDNQGSQITFLEDL